MRVHASRRAAAAALASLASLAALPPPRPALAANADIERFRLDTARRANPSLPIAFTKLDGERAEQLELLSRQPDAPSALLPSGVRTIDLMSGVGPTPSDGDRVYLHWKLWAGGFPTAAGGSAQPIDSSYAEISPTMAILGSPAGRITKGLDLGVRGMQEGAWRRLVVPAALGYGDAGLASTETKSRKGVAPGADLYYEVRMMDAGSGRCDQLLRVERVKSSSCVRGLY